MADITMCDVKHCRKSRSCYRKLAIPNPFRQWYSDFYNDPYVPCPHYITTTPKERKQLRELKKRMEYEIVERKD